MRAMLSWEVTHTIKERNVTYLSCSTSTSTGELKMNILTIDADIERPRSV